MEQAPPPPPTFQPGPYRKKSNTGLIIAIVAACIIIPCGLCGIGGYWLWGKAKGIGGCLLDFQALRAGIKDYTQQNDGKLPDADKWQDEVRTFYATHLKAIDQGNAFGEMDPNGDWGCKQEDGTLTGIAYNSDLSGKPFKDVKSPSTTVLIYEIERPSRNANAPYKPPTAPGPKLMGRNRNWMYANLSGTIAPPAASGFNASSGLPDDSSDWGSSSTTGKADGQTQKDNSKTSDVGTQSKSKEPHKTNGIDDE